MVYFINNRSGSECERQSLFEILRILDERCIPDDILKVEKTMDDRMEQCKFCRGSWCHDYISTLNMTEIAISILKGEKRPRYLTPGVRSSSSSTTSKKKQLLLCFISTATKI